MASFKYVSRVFFILSLKAGASKAALSELITGKRMSGFTLKTHVKLLMERTFRKKECSQLVSLW
jgi:hypothetical protein